MSKPRLSGLLVIIFRFVVSLRRIGNHHVQQIGDTDFVRFKTYAIWVGFDDPVLAKAMQLEAFPNDSLAPIGNVMFYIGKHLGLCAHSDDVAVLTKQFVYVHLILLFLC
jgi:hypothetical protein